MSQQNGGVDPNLDPDYAAHLRDVCPFTNFTFFTKVPLDPTGGNETFDNKYYDNLLKHRGLLFTSSQIVAELSAGNTFFNDFGPAMAKMSQIEVLLAPAGEVRRNCRAFNNPPASSPAPVPVPTPASAPTPGLLFPDSSVPSPTVGYAFGTVSLAPTSGP